MNLPKPFRYFPIENGIYEVAPGLRPLGFNFGNGERDKFVFQIDDQYLNYRENKIACYQERISKYFQTANYSAKVSAAVNKFLVAQITKEYPELFSFKNETLFCAVTEQQIRFSSGPDFLESFCLQVQEDIAVVCRDGEKDWLAAIHLCSPSHWSAEEKVGKNFVDIHLPVPGIEKINSTAAQLVNGMIAKGPWVRFVWGVGSDKRLNHHPIPPPGKNPNIWKGRSFNANQSGSSFFIRYERQVIIGLPEVSAALFFTRPYFLDGNEIKANVRERDLLRSALLSMNASSLKYKGLAESRDEIISWLDV